MVLLHLVEARHLRVRVPLPTCTTPNMRFELLLFRIIIDMSPELSRSLQLCSRLSAGLFYSAQQQADHSLL